MSKDDTSESDGLIAAIADRLDSEVQRASLTASLALAETRLAASSAGLLLLFVLLSAALLFVSWLLLLALLWHALIALGLSSMTGLAILLGLHVFCAAGLLFASWRLSRHFGFHHTRKALSREPDQTPPDDAGV